jgi:leucyl-tRNA synthetase
MASTTDTTRKTRPTVGAPTGRPARKAPARRRAAPRAYDVAAVEARWRERWESAGIYRPDLHVAQRPFYNLMMFPYPSAEGLHVGNMYAFIGADVQGRWHAMRGYDVFEPIGFDAGGIHSENFALKQGVHPRELIARTIPRFRKQLQRIGNRFDWSHEVQTTDPHYYRWTQWIFVQLFKAGLAERRTGEVNWCPKDKTVLADEQVIDGRCERCGSIVERRELEQWYLKITRYADVLLDALDGLDWSERVKAAQRHWIGRSVDPETGAVAYHLRDWAVSRQRYWGTPIPIIHCPQHGAVPVPEDQLPVMLPYVEDYHPTGTGVSPLATVAAWVNTTCPVCGGPARRETDVCDNFLDSAWYYLRYPSSDDDTQPWEPELTRKWLPVDMYVGGAEHSVLHLLYARFITRALQDLGHLPFAEPFVRFRANGMITRGGKMSKSKGNVVSPDDYIPRYGADAFRTYMLFMGPYDAGGDFSDRGLGGAVRFLDRLWRFVDGHSVSAAHAEPSGAARRRLHATIQRVTEDVAALRYNTAIAALMAYLNDLEAGAAATLVTRAELRALLLLLAPFAPFITEELWSHIGGQGFIHMQSWPEAEPEAPTSVTLVVQVDGRVRDRLTVPFDTAAAQIEARVLELESVRRHIAGRNVAGFVQVPGRLVNVVTAEE